MTDTLITQEDYITEVLARVDTALNDPDIEWADIDLIRNEVQIGLEGARLVAETMREAALNPGLTREGAAQARAEAEGSEHDVRRVEAALEKIQARGEEIYRAERQANLLEEYDSAREKRDAAAKRINGEYPQMQEAFTSLCSEIMEANDAVDRVNRQLPDDRAPLERPEGFARGFPDRGNGTEPAALSAFRIVQTLLPSLDPGKVAWPPHTEYEHQVLQLRRVFAFETVRNRFRQARENAARKGRKGKKGGAK